MIPETRKTALPILLSLVAISDDEYNADYVTMFALMFNSHFAARVTLRVHNRSAPHLKAGRKSGASLVYEVGGLAVFRIARPRLIGMCILTMMIGGERLEKACAQVQAVGRQD